MSACVWICVCCVCVCECVYVSVCVCVCVCERQFDVEWPAMYRMGARLGPWRPVLFHLEPRNSLQYWVTDDKHGRQCSYVGNAVAGRLTRTDHIQTIITFLQVTTTFTGARSRWHHVQRAVRYVTSSQGARQTMEHSEQTAVNHPIGLVSI